MPVDNKNICFISFDLPAAALFVTILLIKNVARYTAPNNPA